MLFYREPKAREYINKNNDPELLNFFNEGYKYIKMTNMKIEKVRGVFSRYLRSRWIGRQSIVEARDLDTDKVYYFISDPQQQTFEEGEVTTLILNYHSGFIWANATADKIKHLSHSNKKAIIQ